MQDSACCGNDLATAAVDGVSVQRHVVNVEANSAHVLLTEDPLQNGDAKDVSKTGNNTQRATC